MDPATLSSEVRQAFKSVLHHRGFTLAALFSLALGIGATTALFSVAYGVLLRPLPYPDSERLVRLSEYHPGARSGVPGAFLTNFTYYGWDQPKTVEGLAAFRNTMFIDTTRDEPLRVEGTAVTPSLFALLGVRPAHGRLLVAEDALETAPPVAVLSDGFWQERFGGDPQAIGKALVLDGRAYTIVGVAPAEFYFPRRWSRLWTAYSVPSGSAAPGRQSIAVFGAIARMRPGVTPQQVTDEGTIAARSVSRPPVADALFGKGGPVALKVETLLSEMTGPVRPALLLLIVGVGLILLIACANVASLQLTRGVSRQREIAVRIALGASRLQLARQLAGESLVLSIVGGLLGVLLASGVLSVLPSLAPASFPRLPDISLDGAALAFAALVSLAAGLVSGLAPALRSSGAGVAAALRDGSRASADLATQRLRNALVVIEAALAVTLLIGAGLLVRSFSQLMQVDPGYRAENVLVASLSSGDPDRTADRSLAVAGEILARIRALPGVVAAGAGNMTPLDNITAVASFTLPDERAPEGKVMARATAYSVTPGFAEALSLRVRQGRLLGPEDETSALNSIMVNEEFVRQYLSDGKPVIGRRFEGLSGSEDEPVATEIVGVVANVLKTGLDASPLTEMFSLPRFGRKFPAGFQMVIRTLSDPSALSPTLREIVRQIDPAATLETTTLSTRVSASVAQPRFAAATVAAFAFLALSLAAFGLFGAMSYAVTQRRRELGVRSALGASRPQIVRLILRQGLSVATLGLVLGMGLALVLCRLIERLLFGVTPLDPFAFASAPALLLAAAVAACLIPAWRGAAVQPTEALRCE